MYCFPIFNAPWCTRVYRACDLSTTCTNMCSASGIAPAHPKCLRFTSMMLLSDVLSLYLVINFWPWIQLLDSHCVFILITYVMCKMTFDLTITQQTLQRNKLFHNIILPFMYVLHLHGIVITAIPGKPK